MANGLATERELSREVADFFVNNRPQQQPSDALKAIAGAASGWVLTLNYDDSVEKAALAAGREVHPYTWEQLPDPQKAIPSSQHGLNVLHLHGYMHERESIILSDGQYETVEGHQSMRYLLAQLFLHHSACIFASRMDEIWAYQFFTRLREHNPRHVLLIQANEARELKTRLAIDEGQHILTQTFPKRDWAALTVLAERFLLPKAKPVSAPPASAFPVRGVVADFVPPVLAAASGTSDMARMLLPFQVEMDSTSELTAEDLAEKATTLVVGRPGSGKTELLRQAARAVPPDDRAVFVRLAETGSLIGDPVCLLVSWVQRAQSSEGDSFRAEHLTETRFHFLLDGLDEVPTALQAQLAERIASMAAELPQHRFTVTSRHVPATETLVAAGWELAELVTTTAWRNRYLAQYDLSMDELLREAPVLQQLGELLRLPFFLHIVMELRADGRLPERGGAMALANAFIDRALGTPELSAIAPAVRPWLADVALTMQLAGRPELSLDEIGRVALPSGINLGPPEDVIARLTDRSLLEHTDNGVRFVHRLLADALVAEKLIAVGPNSPGLLELVAPAVPSVSELRDEWLPVMTFVGGSDEGWRHAIAERDPLAGARVLPSTASLEDRRGAALLLWQHYVERRVWMSGRTSSRQSLIDDAEAIGKLLRPGDLPDVVDVVLGGIYSHSPQTRSNVMDVLSSAGLDQELLTVVRATLSGDGEEVVRRQAAAHARARGFKEAFSLVRTRALEAEQVEAQVMVSVGARLASDDELLDFAIDVERSGTARHWSAEHEVRERLGAGPALKVLRARYEHGDRMVLGGTLLRDAMKKLPEDEESAEDLGFIAALGGDEAPLVKAMSKHPQAALKGLEAGYAFSPRQRWRIVRLVIEVGGEDLDTSMLRDERLRKDVHNLIEAREQHRQEASEAVPEVAGGDEPEQAEETGNVPTLSELLKTPAAESDWGLQHNAIYFQSQVGDLSQADRRELARRLDAWWPAAGLAAGITPRGNGRFDVAWEVQAILVYGGELRPELSKEHWAQVAQVPLSYPGRQEWLRERYRKVAVSEVAETLTDEGTMAWWRLMETIPGRLPLRVVAAIRDKAKKDDGAARELLERLWNEGRLSGIRKLAEAQGELGLEATRFLAQAGDVGAQQLSLRRLIDDLGSSQSMHASELRWMEGIEDASLLDDLFTALVASYTHEVAPGDFNDTMEPIRLAIRRIGGPQALAGYDELLAEDPPPFVGAQFEVWERDAIAQDLLAGAADASLPAVLENLSLPRIERSGN